MIYNDCSSRISNSPVTITDIMNAWKLKTIASCVLGISSINLESNLNHQLSHSALLLLDKIIDYDNEEYKDIEEDHGIIIEYGDYNPIMNDKEVDYVRKDFVIYHYDKKGGLRYYGNRYSEFCKVFGNLGHIEFNIKAENQMTFQYFLEKVAKKEDNKWIQSNYSIGFTNFGNHAFVVEALNKLKPHFNVGNIYFVNQKYNERSLKQRLDFIPLNIKTELMKYYRN